MTSSADMLQLMPAEVMANIIYFFDKESLQNFAQVSKWGLRMVQDLAPLRQRHRPFDYIIDLINRLNPAKHESQISQLKPIKTKISNYGPFEGLVALKNFMIEIREDVSSALSGLEGGDWEALSDIEGPIFFDKCWRETEQLDCAYRDVTLDPESRKESFKEFISRLFARGQIVRIMLLVDEAINSEQSLWDHNWDNFWQEHETFLHHQITLLIQSKNALKAVRFLNFMADPDRARFIRPFTYRNHLVEMVPTGELASMPEIFQTEIRSLRNFASVFSDEKGRDMGSGNLRNALQKPTAFLLDQVLKQIVDIFIEDKKYDLAHKATTFMQDPLFCDQQLAKVCEKLNRPETFDKFLEMALFIRHAEIRDQQLCAVGYSLMYAGQHEQALEIARSIESAEIRNSLVTELYQL